MLQSNLRQGIAITAIGGFIAGLGLLAFSWLSGSLGLREMWAWGVDNTFQVWHFIKVSHPTPGWVLLLLSTFCIVGLTFIPRLLKLTNRRLSTKAQVYGLTWRWKWNGNQISDLWCYCPQCDSQLVAPYEKQYMGIIVGEVYNDNRLVCEHCADDGTLVKGDPRFRNPDPALTIVNGMGRVIANMPGNKTEFVDRAKREILRTRR